jgi:hypothetical protein
LPIPARDYSDGTHIIHYTAATIEPGHSVVFPTTTTQTAPAYRLSYVLTTPDTLSVTFEIAPPGQTTFRAIASGTLKKQ